MTVGVGRDGRNLGDQPVELQLTVLRGLDLLRVRVEGRQSPDGAHQDAHRVRVVAEGIDQLADVLVEHRVMGDRVLEILQLVLLRQLAVIEQVRHLEEARLLGELLDRVAAVAEDALVAVDEGDLALRRRGVLVRRVVGHQAEVVLVDLDLAQVHRGDGPVRHGELVGLARAVVGDGEGVVLFGHGGGSIPDRGPGDRPRLCPCFHERFWLAAQDHAPPCQPPIVTPAWAVDPASPTNAVPPLLTHGGAGSFCRGPSSSDRLLPLRARAAAAAR